MKLTTQFREACEHSQIGETSDTNETDGASEMRLVIVVKLMMVVKSITSVAFKGLIEKLKVTSVQCGHVLAHGKVMSNAKSSGWN